MQPSRIILDHVRMLSSHPHKVLVTELAGDPITFEIRVCRAEFDSMLRREPNIRSVCHSLAGLELGHFVLKFIICDCL